MHQRVLNHAEIRTFLHHFQSTSLVRLIRSFWRITSSALIYSCSSKPYSTTTVLGSSRLLIGCRFVFNGTKFFFCLHGYSELLGRSPQPMEELRGLLHVRFCPWPWKQSRPPSPRPSLRARDGTVGGFKTTTLPRSGSPRCPGHASAPWRWDCGGITSSCLRGLGPCFCFSAAA